MSSTVSGELRSLFNPTQLNQLDNVRSAMLADPKILDNHSRETRDNQGQEKPRG